MAARRISALELLEASLTLRQAVHGRLNAVGALALAQAIDENIRGLLAPDLGR